MLDGASFSVVPGVDDVLIVWSEMELSSNVMSVRGVGSGGLDMMD
jgi:hypothetical protein